jgi:hypothetical protein
VPLLVDEGAVSSEDEGGAVRRGRSKKGSKVSRTTRTGAVGGEDVDMDEPDNTQQSQEDVATMRSVAKDERLFAKLDFAFIDEYMGVSTVMPCVCGSGSEGTLMCLFSCASVRNRRWWLTSKRKFRS